MGLPDEFDRPVCWLSTMPEGLTIAEDDIRDPVALSQVLRALFQNMRVRGDACDVRGVDKSSKWGRVLLELGSYIDCGHIEPCECSPGL